MMDSNFDWQLDNWKRWCRKKDYLPMAHICQLAALIRQAKQESQSATDAPLPIFEGAALSFNRLVMLLPHRHMIVFLLDYLDKGIRGQMIVYSRDVNTKFSLAGMSKTTFYRRAKEAEDMLKRWTA